MDVGAIIKAAGGPARVARELNRHHATVLQWRRVPAEHAREVARLAGLHPGQVRPDLYDPPDDDALPADPDAPRPSPVLAGAA